MGKILGPCSYQHDFRSVFFPTQFPLLFTDGVVSNNCLKTLGVLPISRIKLPHDTDVTQQKRV